MIRSEVVSGWDNPLDRAVMEFVVAQRTSGMTAVADAVMWTGTTLRGLVLLGAVAAFVVVALRAWRTAFAAGLSLLAGVAAAAVLKAVFERPRPPTELAIVITHGFSFPSTQATETAAVAVAVVLTAPWGGRAVARPVAALLVAATVLVGLCMVYLGAHWPTDVLAGWLLGAVVGSAVGRAIVAVSRRAVRPRSQRV